jgi:hypothetical protein
VPTGNVEEVLQQIFLERFELIRKEDSAVLRMPTLMGEVLRDQELKDMWLKEFLHPFFKRMELMYSLFRVSGKIQDVEPSVIVRSIGGMILGFLIIRIMEGDTSPMLKLEQEKVAQDLSSILLYGLLKKEPSAKVKKAGKESKK